MHELSIASSIIEAVRAEADKHPGARVTKVGARIGVLSGVVPDALSFGFECLVKGTDLEPLALDIEILPRRQHCALCDLTFDVPDGHAAGLAFDFGRSLACPRCGRPETQFAGGDELEVGYLELEGK